VESGQNRHDRAISLAHQALSLASDSGLRDRRAQAFIGLGEVLARPQAAAESQVTYDDPMDGDVILDADQCFRRGIELLRQLGSAWDLAQGLEKYGRFRIEQGDIPGGQPLLGEAIAIYRRLNVKYKDAERLLATL